MLHAIKARFSFSKCQHISYIFVLVFVQKPLGLIVH